MAPLMLGALAMACDQLLRDCCSKFCVNDRPGRAWNVILCDTAETDSSSVGKEIMWISRDSWDSNSWHTARLIFEAPGSLFVKKMTFLVEDIL